MKVAIQKDLVYSRPPGYRPLSLDLYVPPGPARALCLYLHGGGWRVGSRADGPGTARDWTPSFFERVAAMGLAVASLDYRLSGEARWPAQLEDVQAAATFLSLQRKPLGVPTPRTVAWGVSAGGHLAAMHAVCSADAGLDAVVCWYPPTDLGALAGDCDEAGGHGERGPQARESQLLGAPVRERPDLADAASPVRFAQAGAPPFLLLHGTADVLVPPRQSRRLADALIAAGAQATVELVDGAGHMFPELDEAATTRVVERSVRFLCNSVGAPA
ncbi:MAG: alpha/beta hydrolase fold domain-containing protein [Streptosporangiaceae bacterium]